MTTKCYSKLCYSAKNVKGWYSSCRLTAGSDSSLHFECKHIIVTGYSHHVCQLWIHICISMKKQLYSNPIVKLMLSNSSMTTLELTMLILSIVMSLNIICLYMRVSIFTSLLSPLHRVTYAVIWNLRFKVILLFSLVISVLQNEIDKLIYSFPSLSTLYRNSEVLSRRIPPKLCGI